MLAESHEQSSSPSGTSPSSPAAPSLPPRYRGLLRLLVRQWIHQQTAEMDGLPGLSDTRQSLWSADQAQQIEDAIMKMLMHGTDNASRGMIALDWERWIILSVRRIKAWQLEHDKRQAAVDKASTPANKTLKALRRAPKSTTDVPARSRTLSSSTTIPFASLMSSTSNTPSKLPTRPPSIASARSASKSDYFAEQLTAELQRTTSEGSSGDADEEDPVETLCRRWSEMKGYRPLEEKPRDEWEVVRDHFAPAPENSLPGAFPQSGRGHDVVIDTPTEGVSRPATGDLTQDCEMLKAVFCLRFSATSDSTAHAPSTTSTVRLARDSSSGSTHANGPWWGSGRRWSEMTVKASDSEQDVDISFIEGKFALPVKSQGSRSTNISKNGSSASLADSHCTDSSDRPASLTSSDPDTVADLESGKCPVNLVIGGAKADIPSDVDANLVGLVGGTFVVRGLHGKEERKAFERILQRLLYTIESMVIEVSLLDAFRVPREPEPVASLPSLIYEVDGSTRAASGPARRQSLKESGERKGFLHRLQRDTRGVFGGLFRHRKYPTQDEIAENLPATAHYTSSTFDSLGVPPVSADDSRPGIPVTPNKLAAAGPDSTGTPSVPSSVDTHLQLLARLEAIKTSTTPGLVLPPPVLLQRVKEEEQIRRNHATASATPSLPSSGCDTPAMLDHETRPSAYRLGGDVRVGFKAIRSGLDTFDGWIRLQRLDTVRCVAVDDGHHENGVDLGTDPARATICDRPHPESYMFYDRASDPTILSFLKTLRTEMTDMAACARSGCVATAQDHNRCWYHADKKVTVRAKHLQEPEDRPDSTLQAWVSCKTCGTASDSRTVTDLAACYSWGKFLELLIYTDILRPGQLCAHSGPDHLIHHLRTGGISAAISVAASPVLDTRLPQFQVGPSVQKRKAVPGAIESALEALVPKQNGSSALSTLREEIDAYYEDLHQLLQQLAPQRIPDNPPEIKADKSEGDDPTRQREQAHSALADGIEQSREQLLQALESTQESLLNDMRAAFVGTIRANQEAIHRYKKDHGMAGQALDNALRLPDYYNGKAHALPGGHVLVREDDPASIIAYTLSSLAYMTELTPHKHNAEGTTTGRPASVGSDQPCQQGWTVEVKRRDNPKDLFALRSLTKKQTNVASTPSKAITAMTVTPTVPSLELSLEQVHTWSDPSDNLSELVKSIHKAAAQDPILSVKARSPNLGQRRPLEELSEDHTLGSPSKSPRRLSDSADGLPPPSLHFPTSRSASSSIATLPITPHTSDEGSDEIPEGWGSAFSNALYRVGETLGSFKMRTGERSLSSMLGPLSVMSQADNALSTSASNRLPHIQFTYTLGDKLKLGCTVYHAEPFDSLRRRCAIDKEIIASLARVENWDVSGGKSKALFFRTADRRFVIKELVSKWTVSDTNAVLELSPQYFDYMQNTFNKATSLIKIVGFYSVTTHDRQSGVKKQMDLLIMEDLFHKQNISKTFDLKGIEGRKVPKPTVPAAAATGETKIVSAETLFDADLIESMARAPILLYPHAKRILTEAIAADTRFLSAQSVMDYSLLLGLDSSRRELVVGIVDSIGSYNLWKTIESRGKQALTRTGEVTVIPPDQYKDRFEQALNKYFIACPDKWSRTGRKQVGPQTSFI